MRSTEEDYGTEIARDAERHGYTPRMIQHNGIAGDGRLTLWDCDGVRAINTNGGAVWAESDPDGFADLLAQM